MRTEPKSIRPASGRGPAAWRGGAWLAAGALAGVLLLAGFPHGCASERLDLYYPGGGGSFRFRDAAATLYADAYREGFDYAAASVQATYLPGGLTFAGHLSARGLKPNFAYQLKLVGRPEAEDSSGDDASNERLGLQGRWWRQSPDPANSTDADYLAHAGESGYVYQGYLLFDWFVTDATGAAEVDFRASNSLHVLWRTSQRTPQIYDTATRGYEFAYSLDQPAYQAAGGTQLALYGEWEPGRVAPGQLALTPGLYRCQLALTEESFHETALSQGGGWALALQGEVEFTIGSRDATGYVEGLYAELLGRLPENAETEAWRAGLADGTRPADLVGRAVALSPECAARSLSDAAFLTGLYRALLAREGSAAELAAWQAVLSGGESRDGSVLAFIGSAEFVARATASGLPGESSELRQRRELRAFLSRLYAECLTRTAAGAELDAWADQLGAAGSKAAAARAVLFSPEFLGRDLTAEVFVDRLYAGLLGRAADASGRAGWVQALQTGMSRAEVIENFLATPEFQAQ